jgi:chromosomal replication initiator protein
MYLAKHVGRWSTTKIGKFYNGRHHTTVLYSIEKIESLREKDASLDALLELLCAELSAWSAQVPLLSP